MFRSSIGKIFIGLTLFGSALNALAQGTDEALATVGDNSNEPSGWMRIEVAIFVDTSSQALSAELWQVDPNLTYPTNKRWLTDYDEIKLLMDEWGEDAVSIETNGAIAIIPEPYVPPEVAPKVPPEVPPEAPPTPEVNEDTAAGSDLDDDRQAQEQPATGSMPKEPAAQSDSWVASSELTAPSISPTLSVSAPDSLEHQESASLSALNEFDTLNGESDGIGLAGIGLEASERPVHDVSQVALEDLRVTEDASIANKLNASSPNFDHSPPFGAQEVAEQLAANADSLLGEPLESAAMSDAVSDEAEIADEGVLETSDGADETPREAGNFFAIEGLGEDFNGLVGSSERPINALGDAVDNASIDWLSDYETEDVEDSAELTVEPTPPPMPASYQIMPLEMLSEGLRQLENDTGRKPTAVLSWLQTTAGESDAVIVDSWAQNSDKPAIQGTVRITTPSRSSQEFRLSTHIWANTLARYLPSKLPALPLPAAPMRILLIEPETPVSERIEEPTVEFIDITTGLNTLRPLPEDGISDEDQTDGMMLGEDQTFKHAITLRDARDLREGYVRYIDHPVIQVAAVWRELSYAELYELGEAQRVRRDIDSLTRSLTENSSTKSPEGEITRSQPAP